jgi:hypothetical protein
LTLELGRPVADARERNLRVAESHRFLFPLLLFYRRLQRQAEPIALAHGLGLWG